VSDHIYLSRERATLLAESYRMLGREVGQSVTQLPGSELREQALAIAGALEHLAQLVQAGRVVPLQRREERREVGQNTRRGLRRLAANRGHQ